MSKILNEISQAKYLFGYKRGVIISEQNSKLEMLPVKYMKCEGGEGDVDSNIVTFGNIGDKMIIKFKDEPKPKDSTDSILTCLGGNETMKDKCFEISKEGNNYMAGLRVDCMTGKYN